MSHAARVSLCLIVLCGFCLSLWGCPLDAGTKAQQDRDDEITIRSEQKRIRQLSEQGKRYQAIQQYKKQVDAMVQDQKDKSLYRYLYGFALIDLNKKWKQYDKCLRLDATYYWCLIGRGNVYVRWRIWDKARSDFQRAKAARPGQLEPLVGMGNLAFYRKQDQKAIGLYKQVLQKQSNNRDATEGLALIYERQNRNDKAISWYNKLLKNEPKNFGALRSMGNLHLRTKRDSQAAGFFERALRIQPKNFRLHIKLAKIYEKIGRPSRALRLYESAVKLPQVHFDTFYRLGMLRSLNGQTDGAIEAFNAARRLNARHPGLLYNLGRLYVKKNEAQKAIPLLRNAQRAKPQDTQIRVVLAEAFSQRREYADVLQQYEAILKKEPKNSTIRRKQSALLQRLGLTDQIVTARENMQVLRKARRIIVRCYKNRLRQKPKLRGKMGVILRVYPERVDRVIFNEDKTTINDAIIRTCVKWTFMHSKFPKIRRATRVRYDFDLRPR